jgi:hypothetical protein
MILTLTLFCFIAECLCIKFKLLSSSTYAQKRKHFLFVVVRMLLRCGLRNSFFSKVNLNTVLNNNCSVRSYASTPKENEKEKSLEKKVTPETQEKNIERLANEAKEKLRNLLAKYANYQREEDKREERKGPFKNYFEDEERNKKSIMYYEDYFDKNTRKKDRDNFIVFKLVFFSVTSN